MNGTRIETLIRAALGRDYTIAVADYYTDETLCYQTDSASEILSALRAETLARVEIYSVRGLIGTATVTPQDRETLADYSTGLTGLL